MNDYVVLDFETANSSRDSACSVGLVKYKEGIPTQEFYSLINPEAPFDYFNSMINGITQDMVEDKPNYKAIYPIINEFIGDNPVVAHYAPFDIGVVQAENNRYNLPNFEFDYFDSYYLSRFTLNLLSYKLDDVSKFLGYTDFDHHNALADCYACGFIINELYRQTNSESLDSLLLKAGYHRLGHLGKEKRDGFHRTSQHPRASKPIDYSQVLNDLVQPDYSSLDPNHPFFDKTMVFTGTLQSMVRREAWQKAVDVGANIGNRLTLQTNILVLGEQNAKIVGEEKKSKKIKKAEQMLSEGRDIELITENDFLRML